MTTEAGNAPIDGADDHMLPENFGEPEVKPAAEDQPGNDAPAEADEGAAEQPKPKKSAQERIDELTRARREAERDRDFYKEQALRGGRPDERPAQVAQPTDDGRPDPADFTNDFDYIEALTDWKADVAVRRATADLSARTTVQTKLQGFEGKAAEMYPDGEPEGLQAFRAVPQIPEAVTDVILASEIGPKIAEHLGDNPRELRRLSGLSPALQARELTLLEQKLSAPPKLVAKVATDAPEPPPTARGAGGRFTVSPDTDDFAAFDRQYQIPRP